MEKTRLSSIWLAAVLAGASITAGGCSGSDGSDGAEDATMAVSQALEETSDSTDAPDVARLLSGLDALRPQAIEGFHCDAAPDITTVEVCGRVLPATVHLEWTGCAGGERPAPDGGTRTVDGAEGGRTPGAGPSDGLVDITYTYGLAAGCTGDVTREQSVRFHIERTGRDGSVATLEGTSSASTVLARRSPPRLKTTRADVTRTIRDASGTVKRSVHLVGEMATAFSTETPPTRTIDGSYAETSLDGHSGTVTLAGVVRPPRNECRWPTGGTLTRTAPDGTTHVLAFGPACGEATLDGTAVELPARRSPTTTTRN